MDDPRDILRAAGVECPEVEAFVEHYVLDEWVNFNYLSFPAILALAELVAKYKWQRDAAVANHCENGERSAEGVASCEFCSAVLADLDRRWATDHQAPPAGHSTEDGCRPSASS